MSAKFILLHKKRESKRSNFEASSAAPKKCCEREKNLNNRLQQQLARGGRNVNKKKLFHQSSGAYMRIILSRMKNSCVSCEATAACRQHRSPVCDSFTQSRDEFRVFLLSRTAALLSQSRLHKKLLPASCQSDEARRSKAMRPCLPNSNERFSLFVLFHLLRWRRGSSSHSY